MELTDFSEMAAALAHEIKNPAAVALAHVNLLRLYNEDAELSRHLNHIEQSLTDICDLVREILATAYNRYEAYEVDLYKILTEILETYRAAWPNIFFSLNISEVCTLGLNGESVLPCYGHETSLRMIFSNLIKNAVEAIEASGIDAGEIEINAKHSENFLNVTICDNGVSACAASETSSKPYGNGLGLAICRSLANGLGAQLSASPTETGGCAVTVCLRVTSCPTFA